MAKAAVNPTQSVRLLASALGSTDFTDVRSNAPGYFLGVYTTPDNSSRILNAFRAPSTLFGGQWYNWYAHLMDFDLSSIDGEITAVKLKLYGRSHNNDDGDAIIMEGTFDSSITSTDMQSFTGHDTYLGAGDDDWDADDVTEYSSTFGPKEGGWDEDGWNELTLNSDAISAAETARGAGNRLKFFICNKSSIFDNSSSDFSTTPQYFNINYYANTDATYKPELVVTYVGTEIETYGITMKSGTVNLKSGNLTIK